MYSTHAESEIVDDSSALATMPASVYRCFLFTDIEGSTALWEQHGESFREALDLHHATIRTVIRQFGGQELVEAGDGFLVAFAEPRCAVECAVAAQQALSHCEWPVTNAPLRVRMGLHAGQVEARENGEYRGVILNRAARIRDAAHGEQIVCTAEVVRALDGVFESRELGRFRLRGLPNSELLFQVDWPGMQGRAFPRPNAAPAYTHNLPQTLTRFFGRAHQIATIRDLMIAPSGERLLTLIGAGGTGKTRLALAAAEALLPDVSHAVFFVPLADVVEAPGIPRAITEALKLDSDAGGTAEEQIAAFFGQEPAVLVLDNFEQLTDVGGQVIQNLLARVPRLKCLVTSRRRLNLPAEREFFVPPLSIPDEALTLDELGQVESVQLFVDRAEVSRAAFRLHDRNASAIANLCRQLEGVPLAIELAAARADVVSPQELAKSLGTHLESLAVTGEAVPARHRTLRAAIDWSFEFLPPALRDFFVNLAVFRGGWTAEAAEAVAATPALGEVSANVLRALSELRSASLIVAEERGGTMRFRMLETVRQYAEERLHAKADVDAVIARHRAFYFKLVEKAEPQLLGKDQLHWLETLEIEQENLRTVLNGDFTDDTGLQMASALAHFWTLRGYLAEGREHVARQMAHAAGAAPLVRLCAAQAAGSLAWVSGDLLAARSHFEHAAEICRESDNRRNLPGMLANIGMVVSRLGSILEAEKLLCEAVQLYKELGTEEQRRAQALLSLGFNLIAQNKPDAAIEIAEESLAILRPIGDLQNLHSAIAILGEAAGKKGDYPLARERLNEALVIATQVGIAYAVAGITDSISIVEQDAGQFDQAVRMFAAAAWINERTGVHDRDTLKSRPQRLSSLRERLSAEQFDQCWSEGLALGRARMKELEERRKA